MGTVDANYAIVEKKDKINSNENDLIANPIWLENNGWSVG